MANWNNPLLSSTYANFLSEVKARDDDAVTLNHAGTATNLPTNAKKWVSASSKFQNWNGSSFDDLVLSVSGGGTGLATLATSRIPYGNGTGALSSDGNFTFDGSALNVGTTTTSGYIGRFYASSNSTITTGMENASTAGTNARAQIEAKSASCAGRILAIYSDQVYIGSSTNTQVNFDVNGSTKASIDTSGNFGIGVASSIGAKLHVQASLGSQCRLAYDASNYANFDVSSAGNLYLNPSGGYTVQKAPNAALADGSLSASNIVFYLNEAGNLLTVKAKYADGTTVKTGTIALA